MHKKKVKATFEYKIILPPILVPFQYIVTAFTSLLSPFQLKYQLTLPLI